MQAPEGQQVVDQSFFLIFWIEGIKKGFTRLRFGSVLQITFYFKVLFSGSLAGI